jgi:hypothetical protein
VALGFDRVASSALAEALIGLDDGLWNEWHGPHDDRPPRNLGGLGFGTWKNRGRKTLDSYRTLDVSQLSGAPVSASVQMAMRLVPSI